MSHQSARGSEPKPGACRLDDPAIRDKVLQNISLALNQKRQHDNNDTPSKHDPEIIIYKSQVERDVSWEYPPEFWDKLSTIPLVYDALKRLDKQTKGVQRSSPPLPTTTTATATSPAQDLALTNTNTRELAQFARHGGPDLSDLRGYYPPNSIMNVVNVSDPTGASTAVTAMPESKKTIGPYHSAFEQHLTDHNVYPTHKSQKPPLEDIMAALAVRRPSLESSDLTESAFESFKNHNYRAGTEADIIRTVIPAIIGAERGDRLLRMGVAFGNLEDLTDDTTPAARSDMYDGSCPDQLDRAVRNELNCLIIPSTARHNPMAPNFFVEIKGPRGQWLIAGRQACYDGAIGARAMHSLQNYGRDEPIYDGNAYTFSATFFGGMGTLELYAHHVTQPAAPGARPEHHMTLLKSFGMMSDPEIFIRGVTAFPNARDLAERYRARFIQEANARAAAARLGNTAPGGATNRMRALRFQDTEEETCVVRMQPSCRPSSIS